MRAWGRGYTCSVHKVCNHPLLTLLLVIHTLVVMEKTDLKEVFSKRYASYKVHAIQTSRLCTHMKGKSKKRNPQIHIVPAVEISCYVKDGKLLNFYPHSPAYSIL